MQPTFMARKFGVGSTVTLAVKGGAVLHGIWVSTKGVTGTFVAYDAATSVTGADIIPSTIMSAKGWQEMGDIGCGTGLTIKAGSVSGAVIYSPSSSL